MRADIPLTEDDRAPWLATLRALVERLARAGRPGAAGVPCFVKQLGAKPIKSG